MSHDNSYCLDNVGNSIIFNILKSIQYFLKVCSEDYGIDWVEEEIAKLEEIPTGYEYDVMIEDFGVPQWAPEFQRVLSALENRRQELRLQRIDNNTQKPSSSAFRYFKNKICQRGNY
jgi:hypothetical protein